MARQPTARPLTEHLATLTRMVNQLSVGEWPKGSRRAAIIRKLGEVIAMLQRELVSSSGAR